MSLSAAAISTSLEVLCTCEGETVTSSHRFIRNIILINFCVELIQVYVVR